MYFLNLLFSGRLCGHEDTWRATADIHRCLETLSRDCACMAHQLRGPHLLPGAGPTRWISWRTGKSSQVPIKMDWQRQSALWPLPWEALPTLIEVGGRLRVSCGMCQGGGCQPREERSPPSATRLSAPDPQLPGAPDQIPAGDRRAAPAPGQGRGERGQELVQRGRGRWDCEWAAVLSPWGYAHLQNTNSKKVIKNFKTAT